MNQLSLRGFDKDLERKLRETARREGISLNKAALLLMRRGAGAPEARAAAPVVGDALDAFIGLWSTADEKRLLESIAACETVDKALWR